uniref:DEP domain-containing protein 5-like n=1 Tax=Saccoglossus kowalevskii TaxID=10224 RepID=A0ABM0MWE7_SACKO|nr:PREDICTED: DEP domain-containing protein 5-like [Saccoglossus kowalevskii]
MKKQVKLLVHQKTFSEDELILNPKEFAMVNVGDVVKIYHVEDEYSRLLLQVTSMNEDKQQSIKDSISIDQSIATTFNLRTYKDVIVNQVPPEHVTLDLVELTFKDQYISRSDMWRLKNSLVDSCVYITRKVEFSGIRAQISELWAKSEKVACGVISEVTKVVFRSSTAMVYLFLQMSSEMWEFDVYGDLYLEKAIEFLTELFTRWKEKNNFHELTIVLFSRTFYEAQSIEDFPASIRACLLQDYRGQIYEDFYRIIALNERRDDWRPLLVTLKKVFNQYPKQIIRNEVNGEECPPGYNSTSVVGNFLEAINLSLNVFDKHYVNRNFDRTGQLAIVITPGAGVFEVDRDLCNITKQRMIDNGIGSDLVCMAEQPLHAAPLFKFHNKQGHTDIGDDYNIPYWINHSFYTSKHQQQRAPNSFIPRIKLAETVPLVALDPPLYQPSDLVLENGRKVLTDIDYDAYDAQVFKIPSHVKHGLPNHYLAPTRFERYTDRVTKRRQAWGRMASVELKPVTSDVEVPSKSYSSDAVQIPRSRTRAITISGCNRRSSHERKMLSKSFHESGSVEENDSLPKRTIVGSASMVTDHSLSKAWPYAQRQRRALINPFAPSQMFDRLTSNKRRWTHTFPIGPSGKAMQTHHQLTLLDNIDDEPYGCSPPTRKVTAAASAAVEFRKKVSVHARTTDSDSQNSFGFHSSASMSSMSSNVSLQSLGAESVKTVQSIGSVINTHELTTG